MAKGTSGVPHPRMAGEGTVTPPDAPKRASYDLHYKEFLSRGLSKAESERLAKAVVARDVVVDPLELSPAEAKRRQAEE